MKQKFLSLVLVVIMVGMLFTGCGSKTTDTEDADTTTEAVKDTTGTTKTDTKTDEPLTNLRIAMFAAGDASDASKVQDAVNVILKEKINAEVQIDFINFGAYRQQTNLMLSSGESFDLMPTLITPTLATYVANGQFIPLDDLLQEYGQGILENIAPQYIDCGKINGEIYGITTNRDLAASFGFTYRKDLGEKYGIDPTKIKTLEDVGNVLKIIKENEPDLYPLVPQSGAFISSSWGDFDNLGDGNWLGVLENVGATNEVVNYYTSDAFKQFVTITHEWYQQGLIMPDILNNTETGNSIVKNGKAFGYLSNTKPGFDQQETRAAGMDMVTVDIIPAFATTSNVQGIVWAIPTNSENPEKAMQLMNLMYSDKDISNLLIYGIKDVHYKVIDEANGIIDYADGVDASNTGYPGGTGWGWPNQFLGYVWNGNPADYWTVMDNFNRTATPSGALGFVFNADAVATEMAACANVIEQYKNALMGGVIDPVDGLAKFEQELKDNGIDVIIAEKQRQLDEWAAANK